MKRNVKLFDKIDSTDGYSDLYKERLKETYDYFKQNGFELKEHALNRVLGQKSGKGKHVFSKEELLAVLSKSPNYKDGDRIVKYYNGISAVIAPDTGEVISVVVTESPNARWKEFIDE